MFQNKSKIIGLSGFVLIVAVLLLSAYGRIQTFQGQIKTLKQEQERYLSQEAMVIQSLLYKSLPIEKLDTLDFIPKETLATGKKEMRLHKVVFAGIARDNALELPMVMRHIEYLGALFKDYRVIIFENDSFDGTKLILNVWAMVNPKIKIISHDFKNIKRPSIKFLADARNHYLNALEADEYDDCDIAIFVDMDMKYGFDPRGIQDSFSKIAHWDMVCSNGISDTKGTMYDGFAFRSPLLPYNPQNKKDYWHDYMETKVKIVYDLKSDLVPVYSCFGGLAIYKRKYLQDCRYDSIDDDCEHILFHKCMRKNNQARAFMNPAQVIRYSHFK